MAVIICVVLEITAAISGLWWLSLPFYALCIADGAADIVMTAAAVITARHKSLYMLMLPVVFPLLHIVYGTGTLVGLVQLPKWKKSLDGSAEKEIEEVRWRFCK